MRPEYSLIILTVLAGAGQGLFFFIVTGDLAGFAKGSRVPHQTQLMGLAAALGLTLLGMAASFFHLSHPLRGIKAIRKWRFSWLSREVVLLPLFLGAVGLYGLLAVGGAHPILLQAAGLGGIIVVFTLFVSTAMIYGHLKIVREWGGAFTPANFTFTGLICGGAAAMAVYQAGFSPFGAALFNLRVLIVFVLIGLAVKLAYYYRNSRIYSSTTVQTALGINHPVIRLMDTGSAYPTYNTKEYHYAGLKEYRGIIKAASLILLYAVPLAAFGWDYMALFGGGEACMGAVAAASAMAGAFMERWLFFVEGAHAQNLYYGNFPPPVQVNPILQSGKKDAPLPPG